MQCFYHTDRSAVGACRACSRGVCRECAAEVGIVIACKNRHEEAAQTLSGLQARAGRAGPLLPLFAGCIGLLFLIWGLLSQPFSLFTTLFGGVFILLAIVSFVKVRS